MGRYGHVSPNRPRGRCGVAPSTRWGLCSRKGRPIRDNSTRAGARAGSTNHESRARRYALRSVRPSPARVEAPEPGAWLPILDVTDAIARSEAIYALVQAEVSTDSLEVQFSGGLDLIELERPSALAALAEASDLIESDFWSTSGAEFDLAVANPELVGFAPPRAFEGASTSAAGLKSGSNVEHLKDADSSSRVLEGSAKSYSALAKRRLRIRHAYSSLAFVVVLLFVALVGARIFGATPPVRYVAVSVDGSVSTIETRGRSVSDALAAANVELGKHDRVLPSASTPLTDETNVRVLRSFPVILDFDGTTRRVQTTRKSAEALSRELALGDAVVTSAPKRLSAGAAVTLRTPRSITVLADGSSRTLTTTNLTIGEALFASGVAIGVNDEVTPPVGSAVTKGLTIRVTRLSQGERAVLVAVPAGEELRNDSSLDVGAKRVLRPGTNGQNRVIYRVALRDGVETSRQAIRTEVVVAPVTRIVAVGTRSVRRSAASGAGAPAVQGTSRSESGQGTHYAFTSSSCAHKSLPFGTVVRIINLNSGASTTCTIRDRGPFATGRIIDMSLDTFARLAPLSQGVIPVRIEW